MLWTLTKTKTQIWFVARCQILTRSSNLADGLALKVMESMLPAPADMLPKLQVRTASSASAVSYKIIYALFILYKGHSFKCGPGLYLMFSDFFQTLRIYYVYAEVRWKSPAICVKSRSASPGARFEFGRNGKSHFHSSLFSNTYFYEHFPQFSMQILPKA